MRSLIFSLTLFLAVISGTSKPLLLLSSALILLLSFLRLNLAGFSFRINHISTTNALAFVFLFAVTVFTLPGENISKLVMTLVSSVLAVLIVGGIRHFSIPFQIRIYSLVLGLILLGDLIHLSGLLGGDMNVYKSLVQFDELSNLERERDVGLLGLRYHGWFAEPSYHGAFTGLLCALIWSKGARAQAILNSVILFVLCPTPMMALAFGSGIVMGKQGWLSVLVERPFTTVVVVVLAVLLISGLFASRFAALASGAEGVASGEYVNSSEAIRLVYPVLALSSHMVSYGVLPESIGCVEQALCLPESLKFPLITFMIFFGLMGLITLALFIGWLYRANAFRILVVLFIASILSGGGGYVLHFGLIIALLLHVNTRAALNRSTALNQENNIHK